MSFFSWMRLQLAKAWPLVVLQVVCYAAMALMAAAVAGAIQAITNAIIAGDGAAVGRQVLPVVGLVALGSLFSFGATVSSGVFGSFVSRNLRSLTIRQMLGYPYAYYETHHTGDLVSRLTNDINRIQGFFENTFGTLIREPIMFVVVAVWMATIDLWLLIPILVLTPITVVYNLRLGPQIARHYRQQHEGFAEMTKAIQDTVQGIGVVKVYGLQGRMMEKIGRANRKIAEHFLQVIAITSRRGYVSGVNRHIPLLLTLLWGGWRTLQGDLTPGALFAFLYLFRYLNGALAYLPDLLSETQGIGAIVGRIDTVLTQAPERTDGQAFPKAPSGPIIEVQDVHFAYTPAQPVLQGLSVVVEPGQTVALVGTSGCGKSTLLKLLCGFDEPTQGRLLLHGHDYREWKLSALRDHVSLVSQDTFLFPASVAENIGYGTKDANDHNIVEAARAAGAAEFIEALPQGYQTQVGERGVRLSGGQRQRLSIARALLKDAPILLLDEPTSSLDAESEALVQAAIDRLMAGRTVIVAAHRLRTVRQAHQILVIEEGRIVESGTHESLLAAQGPYRRLYSKQMEADA